MSARSPSPRRSRTPPRRSASPPRAATSSDAPYTSTSTSSSSAYGQDQPQGKRVFVGGLSLDTRADDVEHAFAKYNPIKCDLKNGYGFLEFSNTDDAEDAIKAMDGTKLDGRKIQVEMAKGKVRQSEGFRGPSRAGPRPNAWRVEVEGLDSRISWQDLKDFGRDGGTLRVAYTDVKTDSRGERIGIIEYMSREDMQRALRNLDDTRCGSSYVRLYEEKRSAPPRGRSRSRSRSRTPPRRRSSRSRSRSRSPPRRY